jgi:hypothetical protein
MTRRDLFALAALDLAARSPASGVAASPEGQLT